MRNVTRLVPASLLLFAACATTAPPATTSTPQPTAAATAPAPAAQAEAPAATRPSRPGMVPIASRGLTCRSAVILDATTESAVTEKENAWIAENYPGATRLSTTTTTCSDKQVHQVELQTADNGPKRTLFFDITAWTGKGK